MWLEYQNDTIMNLLMRKIQNKLVDDVWVNNCQLSLQLG